MNLSQKRIILTGGSGFLGTFVYKKLVERGCRHIFVPRSLRNDLRDRDAIRCLYNNYRPHIVIHLAAVVGGIGANKKHPGQFFYDNAIMGIQLIEESRLFEVEKFVAVGTICAYPKHTPVPFREEDLWDGYPEETNAPYGLAKKMMLVQAQAYRQEYGFNAIYLLPVNLYGPHDNFDLESSHVIPAMIRKCVEARIGGEKEIILWGDGTPTREFLYVEDAAEALVLALEKYDKPEPVNLGSGEEISMRDLALCIAKKTGYNGRIMWDDSKPNGQPRRCLDTSRAKECFGFQPRYTLQDGLDKTIEWFEGSRDHLREVKY